MSSLCSYVMQVRGNKKAVMEFCADIFDGCSALDAETISSTDEDYCVKVSNTCDSSLDFEFGYMYLRDKTHEHGVIFSAESFNDANGFSERLFFDRGIKILNEVRDYHEFWKSECSDEEWVAHEKEYNIPGNEFMCDGEFMRVTVLPTCLPFDIMTCSPIPGRGM